MKKSRKIKTRLSAFATAFSVILSCSSFCAAASESVPDKLRDEVEGASFTLSSYSAAYDFNRDTC